MFLQTLRWCDSHSDAEPELPPPSGPEVALAQRLSKGLTAGMI